MQNRAACGTDTRVSVPWHRYGGTDTLVKKLPQGYPKMLRSSYTTKSYPTVSHFGVVLGVHTVTGGIVVYVLMQVVLVQDFLRQEFERDPNILGARQGCHQVKVLFIEGHKFCII